LSRRIPIERDPEAGFTLIEALIALALVSILLVSIGSLVATNAQNVRHLEQHVALMETARLIASGIPRAGEPLPRDQRGQMAGFAWQMRASPFRGESSIVAGTPFVPTLVELRVRSPSGAILSLQTIRLQTKSER
jgi:general secretion pathway protein I